jgi:ABC-type phosphate transport system substrate-binding protein
MWKKLIIVALVFTLKLSGVLAQSADLAVIVNKNSGLDNVTSEELAKIFRAEKPKDPNGTRFTITAREAGSPERTAALAQIFKMSEDDYSKYFLQATFTGQVTSAPRTINGAAVAKQFVSVTPGAISYIRSSDADDSVKILKVDGKAPGEPGYPLTIK